MHKLNVIVLGSQSFISTINELSVYLKFNISSLSTNDIKNIKEQNGLILCDDEFTDNKTNLNLLKDTECVKILANYKNNKNKHLFDYTLELPTTIHDLNAIIETTVAKRKFEINSSIKFKEYFLDKNEKKLNKNGISLILTEKEIQLLELFLKSPKPISKNKILSLVWNYASDADTHTVETHIYRLRKKIAEKFSDEKFILNSKEGYYL